MALINGSDAKRIHLPATPVGIVAIVGDDDEVRCPRLQRQTPLQRIEAAPALPEIGDDPTYHLPESR